jgi:hypothetical protein
VLFRAVAAEPFLGDFKLLSCIAKGHE